MPGRPDKTSGKSESQEPNLQQLRKKGLPAQTRKKEEKEELNPASNRSMFKNVSVLGRAERQSPEELNPGCGPTHTYKTSGTQKELVFKQGQRSCGGRNNKINPLGPENMAATLPEPTPLRARFLRTDHLERGSVGVSNPSCFRTTTISLPPPSLPLAPPLSAILLSCRSILWCKWVAMPKTQPQGRTLYSVLEGEGQCNAILSKNTKHPNYKLIRARLRIPVTELQADSCRAPGSHKREPGTAPFPPGHLLPFTVQIFVPEPDALGLVNIRTQDDKEDNANEQTKRSRSSSSAPRASISYFSVIELEKRICAHLSMGFPEVALNLGPVVLRWPPRRPKTMRITTSCRRAEIYGPVWLRDAVLPLRSTVPPPPNSTPRASSNWTVAPEVTPNRPFHRAFPPISRGLHSNPTTTLSVPEGIASNLVQCLLIHIYIGPEAHIPLQNSALFALDAAPDTAPARTRPYDAPPTPETPGGVQNPSNFAHTPIDRSIVSPHHIRRSHSSHAFAVRPRTCRNSAWGVFQRAAFLLAANETCSTPLGESAASLALITGCTSGLTAYRRVNITQLGSCACFVPDLRTDVYRLGGRVPNPAPENFCPNFWLSTGSKICPNYPPGPSNIFSSTAHKTVKELPKNAILPVCVLWEALQLRQE
ncbi:hypothetical protein B0H17DRAFT_1150697 [Mycena rosella]|uniref:Uncharacterized protein n=1 Tax=Mycena rosella TaxID=1033263 RepID=A0AAD7FJJ5_MYCRO|nr:hypothetical protein B0H17DRAFT_1150697 [Mycena rosella]